MPEIYPFPGVRYNPAQVDLNAVTCPPYDVISPEERQELLERDEHNAVRLILGDGEDWHQQAAALMKQWMAEGVLSRDKDLSLYLYQHDFELEGEPRVRRGFVALLRLPERDQKDVLPHEHTFEGPKADRLKLMKACEANMSPIFLLASDPEGTIRRVLSEGSENLEGKVTDPNGVVHSFCRITSQEAIEAVQKTLAGQSTFIADGHHRFETALNYRDWRRQQSPDDPPGALYNYQMVYLCPVEDKGLHILPTHRIVGNLSEKQLAALDEELKNYFRIDSAVYQNTGEFTRALVEARKQGPVIGLYRREGQYNLLYPKPEVIDRYVGDSTRTLTWKQLDVSILHEVILHRILDIPRDRLLDYVKYMREASQGVRLVNEDRRQLAFLLNGTPAEQVRKICLEGEHMPQKSTDFYPKLLTGLVFYKF
jgi:uncharacterized protein (DUF1015 family)